MIRANSIIRIMLFILLTSHFTVSVCSGQEVPQQISYQGKLLENGQPVTGNRTFVFTIGTWTETHTDVSIDDGLYSVQLGSINPIPNEIFSDSATTTLQITVDGTLLAPDVDILSVPYAFKAENALRANQLGEVVYLENTNVGIGTTTPQAALDMGSGAIRLGGETRNSWPQGADNLGNHTATQNIKMKGYWLSGDGDYEGLFVNVYGNVGVGTYSPRERLEVNGVIRANSVKIDGNFNANGVNGVSREFKVVTRVEEGKPNFWLNIYQRQIRVTGGIITYIGPETSYSVEN